jgi:rhamnogalacturonan endolyase
MRRNTLAALVAALLVTLAGPAVAQRQMEDLGRGLVAVRQEDGGVFVGWRLLGTDPPDLPFNVYRATGGTDVRLNEAPLAGPTHFLDRGASRAETHSWYVRPVLEGAEGPPSRPFSLGAGEPARPYISIPLRTPPGYHPNDVSVGDLDGDGEYDLVVHMVGRGRDNSQAGFTTEPILHAYKLDGTFLWEINLGKNIREGAHYTQFMVYDLDGDGRAEVVLKTADGTVDGAGAVIGDPDADWRNPEGSVARWRGDRGQELTRDVTGYVTAGPEYLTVFEGRTGAALATVDYIPQRHPATHSPTPDQMHAIWGDGYANRMDRFLAGVAYLDGVRPSVVMARGYYTRAVLAAFHWRDGRLQHVWTFDSDDGTPGSEACRGQGAHSLAVADVDGDGRDEIVYGSCVIGSDGRLVHATGWGHGDALHVSRMDPDRPGLQIFMPHEVPAEYGPNAITFRDALTGELIWGVSGSGDVGRGVAMDVDPRYPGYEMWAIGDLQGIYTAQRSTPHPEHGPRGQQISTRRPAAINFGIWWDGDLLRELLDRTTISKWNWEDEVTEVLFSPAGVLSINGTKATPNLSADILGDWREEVIFRSEDNDELRIFTTTIPTEHRMYTLMHDPVYRLSVAWQNVGYNQPPHPGFFLGHGMQLPPAHGSTAR